MVRLQVVYNFTERSCFVSIPLSLLPPSRNSQTTPLTIQWRVSHRSPPSTAYLSSSGKPPSSKSSALSSPTSLSIEIPHLLARALHIPENTVCDVQVLGSIASHRSVFVEPVTVDDWERIEHNADVVEKTLLSQIDMLTVGVPFPVFLRGNTVCYLQCKQGSGYVRLGVDSEVVVASKTREKKVEKLPVQVELRVQVEESIEEVLKDELNASCMVLVAKDQYQQLADGQHGTLVTVTSNVAHPHLQLSHPPSDQYIPSMGNLAVVRMASTHHVKQGHVVLSRLLREQLAVYPACTVLISQITSTVVLKKHFKLSLQPLYFIPRTISSLIHLPDQQYPADILKEAFLNSLQQAQVTYSMMNFPFENSSVPLVDGTIVSVDIDQESLHLLVVLDKSDEKTAESRIRTATGYVLVDPDLIDADSVTILPTVEQRIYLHDPFLKQPSIDQLGGFDSFIADIRARLDLLLSPHHQQGSSLQYLGAWLICGSSGSGKSALSAAIGKYYRTHVDYLAHVIYVPCGTLVSDKQADLESMFVDIIRESELHAPSLIVLDDLDKLIPNAGDHDMHHNLRSSKLAEKLADLISDHKGSSQHKTAFIATSSNKSSLHSSLQLPGLFCQEFNLGVPDASGRHSMLKAMIQARDNVSMDNKLDLEDIQTKLEGCLPVDLRQLVDRAIHCSIMRSCYQCQLRFEDFIKALEGFSASSLKQLKLHSSETTWEDIGGLEEVCRILKETLELPSKYSLLFSRIPLKLRSGILLYGPPGCGKTMLAAAVAKECGLNFISVKGPELLNKYIGASEQSVREVFQRAAAAAPCIVFFDEFDSIAPRRGGDSTGVTDRVVNQLLCHLDGVEGRSGVYVLAATSRPDLIDPALLRPGRLDKSLYCGIPDLNARQAILKSAGRKMLLDDSVDFEDLASRTEFYSGADLQGLFTSAQILAMHELLEEHKAERSEGECVKLCIHRRHFEQALKDSRVSVSESERQRYSTIYSNFVGSRSGNFSLQGREGETKLRTMLK